jgi:hypothetical protein
MGLVASQSLWAADSGFYVDVGMGYAKADLNAGSGVSVDDSDTSYSVGLGYNFSKYPPA